MKNKRKKCIKEVTLFYQNVRGLRSKTSAFYKNILQSSSDIIALTETFLTSSVLDAELFPSGYKVFRKDRGADVGWGGVLLAVKDQYDAQQITDVDSLASSKEVLFVRIIIKGVKLLICVVYLPPDYGDEQYVNVLTCIENAVCKYPSLEAVIVGDFNLNSCSVNARNQYECFLAFCGVKQHNEVCNAYGGILDLVLTGLSQDMVSITGDVMPLVPIDLYHPPLEVIITVSILGHSNDSRRPNVNLNFTNPTPTWNFWKADLHKLYELIAGVDWSDVLNYKDADLSVETFYKKLNAVINPLVPQKKSPSVTNRFKYPSWFTPELIHFIKLKYFNLKKFKSHGLEFNKELFRYYRTLVKNLVDRDYNQYLITIERGICLDPGRFWDFVRSKRQNPGQNEQYTYRGEIVSGQEAVDAFAEFFGSVFHDRVPNLDPEEAARPGGNNDDGVNLIEITHVSVAELRAAVKRLKPSTSAGPDGIPSFLVKDCMSAFEQPLLYIFNLSLKTGIFPSKWKVSRVTPIPKVDRSNDILTYRPIAILSAFGKVFESVINGCLTGQINNRLNNAQHGFRSARSTATNHVCFFDYVLRHMDTHGQVDAVYFDFAKAFDLVDNDVLLMKFSVKGFAPKLISFFANYLKDRRQYVQMSAYRSKEYFTRSGVSQGSNLGPTQFLIMIDDLMDAIVGGYPLMFADDLKVMLPVNNESDCNVLQQVVDSVLEWSVKNKLQLNVLKCKAITFTRSNNPIIASYHLEGAPLDRVDSIQDLGLTLDTGLNMRKHIVNTCKSANKSLGFIMRTASQFHDDKVSILLYNAYVRSKLEYSAIVWDPSEKKYILLIERIQRKFARYLYKRRYHYYPFLYPSLFVSGMVGLETLEFRRVLKTLAHYCLLLRHEVDNPTVLEKLGLSVPGRYTGVSRSARRARNYFAVPFTRTQYASNAPTTRATVLLNAFLAQIQEADVFADKWRVLSAALSRFVNVKFINNC